MMAIRSLATILTYLIGLCGMIPLFPWLTNFPRVILIIGLIAGLWQDRRGSWQLKPWMQNGAIVPVFIYYLMQFSRANPVQPVVSALAIMLAVRLGGEKSVRHSLQIYVIAIFCLASSSLFDLSPLFLMYLGLLLFMVALALVLLTFQDQDSSMTVSMPELKKILISALLMPVIAVPLLLIFFPIMPRTQFPLWNFLNPANARSSGYTDTVEPGTQSSISESRTLAFRAEMHQLAPTQLYWRATVFNRTDGNKWTRNTQIPSEQPKVAGLTVNQAIFPEPSGVRTLIALDRPVSLDLQRVVRSPDGVFESSRYSARRLSYNAASQISGSVTVRNSINRLFYLQLPDRLPPRIVELAKRIAANGEDDRARVGYLENYFRNGGFRYATKGLATGDRAIEQFLFEKKLGHCEFFASSFALLLRAAGVPCRLVGGYLGGEYNQLGGYYLVSDDKAHVWVEAYIEESGWVRIDPSGFATNSGEVFRPRDPNSLKLRISLALDSLNHTWNRSVIAYDFERQMNIAHHLGSRIQEFNPSKTVQNSVPYLVGCLLLVGVLFAAGRLSLFQSREQRILKKFIRIVEQKFSVSIDKSGSGLFEAASLLNNEYVSDFVTVYANVVYHDRRLTDEEYLRLQLILRNMKGIKS